MKNRNNIVFLLCLFISTYANAQISTNEKPISFSMKLETAKKSTLGMPAITMPSIDIEKLKGEDKENEKLNRPYRFGYTHKVNYSITDSGVWYELPNGDRLWQLSITCPNALSVNLCYDRFWLPEGGKFFVYSADKTQCLGAYTSRNDRGCMDKPGRFATAPIKGGNIVLEYYHPNGTGPEAVISIEYIVHGYRNTDSTHETNSSTPDCFIDINCDEGQEWQLEKNAVALVFGINTSFTGALINTTDLSQKPYFLTARHCLTDDTTAISVPTEYFMFTWDYERKGCGSESGTKLPCRTVGAEVVADNFHSDFALLRLLDDPAEIANYSPYYLGWDSSGNCGGAGVCIHHPLATVKRISTTNSQQATADGKVWETTWMATQNGYGPTAKGSSGSPLINDEHKVIGQLFASYSTCAEPYNQNLFSRFDVAWTGDGSGSPYKRLDCWLDSISKGVLSLEGLLPIATQDTISTDKSIYSNIRICSAGQLTVQGNVTLLGRGILVVEHGGTLIVDGGRLSGYDITINPGATLRIVNDGTIEARNEFEVRIGATMEIESGKIL